MLIQPEDIFILSSHIEANQKFGGGEVKFDVKVGGKLYENRDDPAIYNATLSLKLVSKNKSNPLPYKCKLELVGHFHVSDEVPSEKKEEIVGVNGLSILYGSAREHILSITSRGPHPSICLPCISFRKDAKEYESTVTSPAKTSKTGRLE